MKRSSDLLSAESPEAGSRYRNFPNFNIDSRKFGKLLTNFLSFELKIFSNLRYTDVLRKR